RSDPQGPFAAESAGFKVLFVDPAIRTERLSLSPKLVHLRIQETLEEPRIQKLAFHSLLDNLQGVFGGYGTLVRPVAGSKGVIDIGDGHHPRLHRNLLTLHM